MALVFAGLLASQVFHQVEHVLDLAQKRFGAGAGPVLNGAGSEWAHLAGNTLLLAGVLFVVVRVGRTGPARHGSAWLALRAALVLQCVHVVEHVVAVWQYVTTGRRPPGLLGQWLDPVWFHFSVNLVFLAGLVVGFVGLGVYRDLAPRPPARVLSPTVPPAGTARRCRRRSSAPAAARSSGRPPRAGTGHGTQRP